MQCAATGVTKLTDKLAVIDAGGANVTAFVTGEGLVVVDSGAPNTGDAVMAALKSLAPNAKVTTLFNTHYHLDQTANNAAFAAQGAKIISQKRTREWLSRDYWNPAVEQYVKARPKAAWPTETFVEKGTLKTGGEDIDYGYLLMAHTSGDAYFHFKSANVIAVGDVASPVRDPELDWFTGGWVGGRVDSMDLVLSISNDQTRFIPAYGPAMTRGGVQGGARHDGRGPAADLRPGPRGRRPEGHAGGRRSRRPSAQVERSDEVFVCGSEGWLGLPR